MVETRALTAAGDNTRDGRLFTNDANTNNAIGAGLIGVGLGVGGVLLTQAFLDSQEKERCRNYYRQAHN